MYLRPYSLLAGGPDPSSVILNNLAHNGKSDAASPLGGISGGIRPVKPVKNIRQILGRNSLAVILNSYLYKISYILYPNIDNAPFLVKILDRVADDVINYPVLCCGGMGVISVTSNLLPNKIAELTHSILLESNYQKAHNLSNELYAINKALFIESNPIPIKAAMYLSGLLHTLEYRLPLVPPSAENLKILENILTKYEVVK